MGAVCSRMRTGACTIWDMYENQESAMNRCMNAGVGTSVIIGYFSTNFRL